LSGFRLVFTAVLQHATVWLLPHEWKGGQWLFMSWRQEPCLSAIDDFPGVSIGINPFRVNLF